MRQRGFTLIEILFVITLIGVMLAVALPRLGDAVRAQRLRSARDAIVAWHARVRAVAVQEANYSRMVFVAPGKVRLEVWDGGWQPRDSTDLQARYGTTFTTGASMWFDPRGLGYWSGGTVTLSNGTDTEQVSFSPFGKVIR